MTSQEAAHQLLTEAKKPMSAMALARLALGRQLVSSSAKKKIYSVAQTIEKNVRDGTYNNPKLKFVFGRSGERMLALPEWDESQQSVRAAVPGPVTAELTAQVQVDVLEQIQLAVQAKVADGFDATVAHLLRRGLSAEAANIRDGLMKQLSKLDQS